MNSSDKNYKIVIILLLILIIFGFLSGTQVGYRIVGFSIAGLFIVIAQKYSKNSKFDVSPENKKSFSERSLSDRSSLGRPSSDRPSSDRSPSDRSPSDRLTDLNKLYENNLISEDEYEAKRKDIIDKL
jgi:hypothetical protein